MLYEVITMHLMVDMGAIMINPASTKRSTLTLSGISEVGVITKSNFQSLIDHLGSGREWDLARKKGGLHILPPYGNTASGT